MTFLGRDEPRFIQEAVRRINMEIKRIVEGRLKKQIIKEMLRDHLNKEWKSQGWKVIINGDGNLAVQDVNDPIMEKILAIMVEGLAKQIKFEIKERRGGL